MTWYEAQNACNKKLGHLVEIDTVEEQNILVAESQKRGLSSTHYLWIGIWRWSQSGEGATFSAWLSRQPNSSGGDQDYAVLDKSGWNDLWCDKSYYGRTSYGAICEK